MKHGYILCLLAFLVPAVFGQGGLRTKYYIAPMSDLNEHQGGPEEQMCQILSNNGKFKLIDSLGK